MVMKIKFDFKFMIWLDMQFHIFDYFFFGQFVGLPEAFCTAPLHSRKLKQCAAIAST